jgi:hypothetical protein
MLDYIQCALPEFQKDMTAITYVESGYNPLAIAIIKNGRVLEQPKTKDIAKNTLAYLDANGIRYSAGVAQINKSNWAKYGLTHENVFDACTNVNVGSQILKACYDNAKGQDETHRHQMAWSCYYSGNYSTGFQKQSAASIYNRKTNSWYVESSYVEKVAAAYNRNMPIYAGVTRTSNNPTKGAKFDRYRTPAALDPNVVYEALLYEPR